MVRIVFASNAFLRLLYGKNGDVVQARDLPCASPPHAMSAHHNGHSLHEELTTPHPHIEHYGVK